MSFLLILIGSLLALVLAILLVRRFQEWRISRHNRKVTLDYLKKLRDARIALREATPEEIARFRESPQYKQHPR